MPSPYEPKEGQDGLLWNGAMVPFSAPLSYVPCKGEVGLKAAGMFYPIEPLYTEPHVEDTPLIQTALPIDREPPWIDQVDMRVATPCVSPYNWTVAAANRTLILDTVVDADATDEEKALPGYVPNPGLVLSSRTHRDFTLTDFGDTNGIAYIWTYGTAPAIPHPAVRSGQTRYTFTNTAGSFIVGRSYKIVSAGTTNFTLIGSANNSVGTVFTATGAGTGTGTADDRTITALGTVWDGVPFLPGSGAALIGGKLNIRAYRYGLLLSDVAGYAVTVKIGRAKATWSKAGGTLTLETTETTGTTIKYSVDGGTPTLTYTTPLSIAATATVRWYATKTGMVDSDEWQTVVTFGAEGPDDFETVVFSSLPAFSNSPVQAALKFQRKPDWYISPAGTGDGLTPSTPSNVTGIIGLSTTTGKARGSRWITATKSGTANLTLTRGGVTPTSSTMKYSEDGTTFSTYSSAITPAAPGRVWFKLVRADATDFTRRFCQPWFIGTGTGVQIRAQWSLTAKTLTLTYEPTPLESADVQILYSLDGSSPSLPYSGPVAITANCTPKVKAIHTAREPHDFSSATGVYTCTAIDITSTADYDETHAATWTADATIPSNVHKQWGDLVWCSEGTYSAPAGDFYSYWSNAENITIRGGYSPGFTERDVKARKSIFWATYTGGAVNRYTLNCPTGVLDGLWSDAEISTTLLRADKIINCHVAPTTTSAIVFSCNTAAGCTGVFSYPTTQVIMGDSSCFFYDCDFSADLSAGFSVSTNSTFDHCNLSILLNGSSCSCELGSLVNGSSATVTVNGSSFGAVRAIVENSSLTATVVSGNSQIHVGPKKNATINATAGWVDVHNRSKNGVDETRFYRSAISGSCNLLTWPMYPVYFEPGDVTITELSPTSSDGNPVRVNGLFGRPGWYSGIANGGGAPLAGYETPQGTGVALGRYWE